MTPKLRANAKVSSTKLSVFLTWDQPGPAMFLTWDQLGAKLFLHLNLYQV